MRCKAKPLNSLVLTISKLFIYPIKSLGGIAVSSALVSDRGFQHDRRWLLVDENHRFLTQRQIPAMALLQVELSEGNLTVRHKQKGSTFSIPFFPESPDLISVQIWNDLCAAQPVSKQCDEWFSQ